MEIIPAIDIRGGHCVRLIQGDFARETVYDNNPVEVAQRWQEAGAKRLHVVDLDGALTGQPANADIVGQIVEAVSLPIQIGGGIRDMATIQSYLEAGVDRLILGTAAVVDQPLILGALKLDRGAITIAVDAADGIVATDGWTKASSLTVIQLAHQLMSLEVPRIIYTDIQRDGTMSHPNYEALTTLLGEIEDLAVIYSGGVSSLEQLHHLSLSGVEGAIIGTALYTGAVDLATALDAIS